ncbi:MAG: hypothetical protein Q4F27_04945 [Desulfovibrionaceae bacterium]|nr:hypothetical protein [Desulfovibrionaceae bacterium]
MSAQVQARPTAEAVPADPQAEAGWVTIPAGAKPAYMGIHGGTMPVSLMVADDGASLLTFVGRTGNDFLEVLRGTDLPVPSLLNATAHGPATPPGPGSLMAGMGSGTMPVITAGVPLALPSLGHLQPFGLSDKPLSIEGHVSRPDRLSPAKRYRLYFEPQYLQPRRNTD